MSCILELTLVFAFSIAIVRAQEVVSNEEIEILQKKLCDKNISKESKDKLIDCMEENLPFLLLEAMDTCIYEAIPNAYTREEIQKSLCDNEMTRNKVQTCMERKQKDFDTLLPKQELTEKFKVFKTCVDSVTDKSDKNE